MTNRPPGAGEHFQGVSCEEIQREALKAVRSTAGKQLRIGEDACGVNYINVAVQQDGQLFSSRSSSSK